MSRDQAGAPPDRCPEAWPHVLREYAMLADGERGALVGPRGEIAWLCAPRWDSAAVFSALLGGPGHYVVQPVGTFVWGGYYETGTLIWRCRWVVGSAVVECREALAFPGDPGRLTLLRRVTAVAGDARVRVALDPRAGFGAAGLRELRRDCGSDADRGMHADRGTHAERGIGDTAGTWHGRVGALYLRWQGGGRVQVLESPDGWPVLSTLLDLAHGETHDLVLELGDGPLPSEPARAGQQWRATEAAWARASAPAGARMSTSAAPRDASRAVAVLRGLTSSSGGMVAAATTSLPERFRAGRNYDYRYVWVRDQCYAGLAAAAAGVDELLDDAVRFLTERLLADGPALAPAYTARGGRVPDESPLDLPGYPGSDARTGNHVNAQFQLDAFGEILLLLAAAARRDRLDTDARRAAEVAVAAIERRWNEPDAGVWELDDRRWTHSRLLCVAGLRAIAADPATRSFHGAVPGGPDRLALADRLLADTAAHATHPSGRWQRSPGDPRLDGSLLLAGLRGAVPADDPRTVATVAAYLAELTGEGYAYRFRHDERPLGDPEGAFLLCNFLVAMAAGQQGDRGHRRALPRPRPVRVRPAGAVLRGVRRGAAPAARQPAAGVRARPAARGGRPAGPRPAGYGATAVAGVNGDEQKEARMATTVVVTGASAGIGRAVARCFAGRGACVALLARGEAGLAGAARDVERAGGRALPIPVDVADAAAVDEAASAVERDAGPIDVWVNSAFASVFAPFDEITPEEFRRVTEVTYLGFVHGTRAALDRMKPRDAGVIVQVGSALGLRSVPLQSAYCGAKHAINGFTSSVQVELRHERSGVAVTVVQMPAVNTPQFSWVRSRLPRQPQPVPPIYQPEVAARAVLFAADHPRRKQYRVGTSTVATVLGEKLASPLLDRYLARTGYAAQQTDRPRDPGRRDNLWAPVDDGPGTTDGSGSGGGSSGGGGGRSSGGRGGSGRGGDGSGGSGGGDHGAHGEFDARSRTRDPQLWWTRHRGIVAATLAGAGAGAVALTAGLRTRARPRGPRPARPTRSARPAGRSAGPARPPRCLR